MLHLTYWQKDLCGYAASLLVLATFSMRSMRPLRVTAIASNVSFIAYAAAAGLLPILVLHSILLPLNVVRLLQLERARRTLRAGSRHVPGPLYSGAQVPD